MKRNYDAALVKRMQENQHTENVEGVKILVKPIPEGGEDGAMDPRLYKSMKWLPVMARFMPKPKKNQTVLEKITPLRKMFNEYKGIQMVEDGVEAVRFQVEGSDGYQIPVRVYRRSNHGEKLPVLIYYHGGGFFGGSGDIVEQMCELLVTELDCAVFNVEYRLCPEHHYPQPFNDCFDAAKWVYEHGKEYSGDPERIAVAGDSAGGNLAAAVSLRDREEKTNMVKMQVLLYPAVNIAGRKTEFYHGMKPEKYHCSKKHEKVIKTMFSMMSSMMGGQAGSNMLEEIYLQGHLEKEHIYASPLLDDMHDLPPTLLLFGEHDFLVFEDFAYARTLQKAGTALKTVVYRGLGHGFADQIGVMPQAEDCIREIAEYMKEIL